MSTEPTLDTVPSSDKEKDALEKNLAINSPHDGAETTSIGAGEDLLAGEDDNVALVRKMHLLNNVFRALQRGCVPCERNLPFSPF